MEYDTLKGNIPDRQVKLLNNVIAEVKEDLVISESQIVILNDALRKSEHQVDFLKRCKRRNSPSNNVVTCQLKLIAKLQAQLRSIAEVVEDDSSDDSSDESLETFG
jgi:uncharacterized coiled-coil protein SlyX